MKIAILGAGAMGCLYASYLAAKHEVTLLDRYQPQVDEIRRSGIVRVEKDGSEHRSRPAAARSGEEIGVQELVIVFVKSTDTLCAIRENARLAGPDTIVMTLQNGAGNNREIATQIRRENIIVGSSSHNSVSLGRGRVFHSGCGPTNLGPDLPSERARRSAALVAAAMRDCGIETNVLENIQQVLWRKLFVNCGINALSTVMDCKIGAVQSDPALWRLCTDVIRECVLVAAADGTSFGLDEVLRIVREVAVNDAEGYASMCQDRHNRRKTEIDKINGTVVQLGEAYQIATPCNRMLVELVHALENAYCG